MKLNYLASILCGRKVRNMLHYLNSRIPLPQTPSTRKEHKKANALTSEEEQKPLKKKPGMVFLRCQSPYKQVQFETEQVDTQAPLTAAITTTPTTPKGLIDIEVQFQFPSPQIQSSENPKSPNL